MTSASRLLSFAFLALAGLVVVASFAKPGLFENVPRTVPDFGAYYAAAVTNRHGDDPFILANQAVAQRRINPDSEPLRANSGPWAIGLVCPLTLLDYPPARLVWLFLELALMIACGATLWTKYGGADNQTSFAWLVSIGGYAGMQSLWLGQLSPFVLGGLVGFVVWHCRRPMLAGACLSLLAVKPQNQLVLILIGTIWMVDCRQWRIFLGIVFGTAALTGLAMAGNDQIFSQYIRAMSSDPPSAVWPPLPASLLRFAFGFERYWLAFVPLLIGSVWGVWYYARHRQNWDWTERFPLILMMSYLASPYGWAYDQIVFLFAFFQVAVMLTSKSKAWWFALIGMQAALTVYYLVMLKSGFNEFHWVWVAPLQLVLYLVTIRFR